MESSMITENKQDIMIGLESQVHEWLQCLDQETVNDYREALVTDPDLVRRETPVRPILQTQNLSPFKAAEHVALWWKTRRELFGEDRWLLPMTCTGAGALCPEYVAFLRSGYEVPVFPSTCSASSSSSSPSPLPVYYVDRGLLPAEAAQASTLFVLQVAFYISAVHAEECIKHSNDSKYNLVKVVRSGTSAAIHQTNHLRLFQQMAEIVPCKLQNAIVIKAFEPNREHVMDYLTERQACVYRYGFPDAQVSTVAAQAAWPHRATLHHLIANGLEPACIPQSMGGDLDHQAHVHNWIRRRISIEDIMGSAPPIRNTEISTQVSRRWMDKQQRQLIEEDMAHNSESVLTQLPTESTKEFHRRRNRIYSRRWYSRHKKDPRALEGEVEALQFHNTILSQDNIRLEGIIRQAQQQVLRLQTAQRTVSTQRMIATEFYADYHEISVSTSLYECCLEERDL